MKYLVLIYGDERILDALPPAEAEGMMAECAAHTDRLRQSGHLLDAKRLEPTRMATTLRMRNGRLLTTDGPFAETKEQLGGFILIEAKDLNDAIRLAAGFPWARTGRIEVRALLERAWAA